MIQSQKVNFMTVPCKVHNSTENKFLCLLFDDHSLSAFNLIFIWVHSIWYSLKCLLKDDAVKELHSICQQIWKTQQWPQDWKRSVFILFPMPKNAQTTAITLISYTSKVMFKILQARLLQYVNCELPGVQVLLEKGEEQRTTSAGSSKKQESSRKTSTSALLTMPKPLTVWITINYGKFWKRWE